MNAKKVTEGLAKVESITGKIVTMAKERDNLLLSLCAMFKKGENVTWQDKDGNKFSGKVIYNVGQKSLTVETPDKQKVNVSLACLVLS